MGLVARLGLPRLAPFGDEHALVGARIVAGSNSISSNELKN